jgi:hypothetical protein
LYVLGAFLVPDIPADDLCRDGIPDGPHKIAVFPELTSPELATQSRETHKECAGGDAFEDLDYPGGCVPWRCGEKQWPKVADAVIKAEIHKKKISGEFLELVSNTHPILLANPIFSPQYPVNRYLKL